jgi:hypothetical protein
VNQLQRIALELTNIITAISMDDRRELLAALTRLRNMVQAMAAEQPPGPL